MDPKEITKLAQSLRECGDKVLAGDFKLCLSGPILRALNDSFTLIAESADLTSPQSFQVVKPNNSKSEVFRDLQLIHDFVQKTVLLCISKFIDDDDFEGNIDISKFRSLRRLEVHKVNIKQIVGIQPLRAQLQHLICNRSIESVADIITYCGGDDSNGFAWNELKTANFSYNNLKTVDSSLEFAQWLQHLTLSYNQLSSVAAIKWLPHLKVLDLRYNRLTTIPSFHTEASRRLQVLIISNNLIEDLGGISRLEALTELDLSNNCLLDHMSLLPLSTLISLRYLNLQDNPLAFHPKHRRAATTYLHKNTASVKFVLDTEPLTKTEKTNVGRYPNYQSVLTMRLTGENRSSGQSTPTRKSQAATPTSSVGSEKSIKLNKSEANEMTISMTEKQKKIKVRSVQIEEHKTEQEESNNSKSGKDLEKSFHLETSTDHLETKKQIEDLRNKYGEGWLKSQNAQSVLGLDTPGDSDHHASQKTLINDFLNDIEIPQEDNNESSTYTEATMLTSTPINAKDNETFNFSGDTIITDNKQEKSSELSVYKTAPAMIDEIYSSESQQSEFDSVSDPEDNEMTYIVTGRANTDQYFLTISDTYIKEKDSLTRRTKTKWSLKILESCERIKSNTLRINFDTIKKDKRERIYTVEEGLCQDLENLLRAVLSKRQLSEMNQIVYRCINCSCQFSRERTFQRRNPVIFCPECKKNFVVEVNESPKTSISPPRLPTSTNTQNVVNSSNQESTVEPTEIQSADRQEPEKSASHSSIANDKGTWRLSAHKNISSAGSLNESSSCSKISNSESSFDSNQSIAGSSTNDRDQDFNFSKNYESDVEVLSNPSQSSIEVLDHGHPSRKTSEERKISRIPSLETIQDQSIQNTPGPLISREIISTETSQNESPIKDLMVEGASKKVSLGPVNLTESSSSGSVTDSICTAYEQGDKDTPATSDAQKKITQPEKDNKKEESIISSMFGGLFQSTNLLMSRTQKPGGGESPSTCEPFKFNYKDFSDVDHRLKLFFYQTKFKDDNEHFKWLVKGKIFNENTYQLYEGILVMSTTKLYVMEIIGPENDEIQKWLKQIFSGTINRIESAQLLPWKIGMSFKIKGWEQFSLILQDISRTDSLLLFFANNPLPDECTIDYQPSEKVRTKLSSFVEDVQLKMFSILNKCEISSENTEQVFSTTAFFTTDTHLYLTSTNLSWLSDNSDTDVESGLMQFMSNIVDVVTPAKNVFTINFLDEIQNKYELWTCTFETDENANSCLNAIGQSWEKLFGVPFFVSN